MMLEEERKWCALCSDKIMNFYYRDHNGWLCHSCGPQLITCKNNAIGCDYRDVPIKVWKHQTYFCPFTVICGICNSAFPEDNISAHFGITHAEKTFSAKSTWRSHYTGLAHLNKNDVIILTDCGPVIVGHTINMGVFTMNIISGIPSRHLHEFDCAVQLSDPCNGNIKTYYVEESYGEARDWHMRVNVEQWNNWSGDVNVSLDITRMKDI